MMRARWERKVWRNVVLQRHEGGGASKRKWQLLMYNVTERKVFP